MYVLYRLRGIENMQYSLILWSVGGAQKLCLEDGQYTRKISCRKNNDKYTVLLHLDNSSFLLIKDIMFHLKISICRISDAVSPASPPENTPILK